MRKQQPLIPIIGVALVLMLPVLSGASATAWAAFLLAGAAYVTAQVASSPQQWRSRSASLALANGLVAFMWFVALAGVVIAILRRP